MGLITKKSLLLFAIVLVSLSVVCVAYVMHRKSAEEATQASPQRVSVNDSLRPKTLDELLALSPDQLEKVDIARINLLCAVGLRGSERLDVEECIRTLDAWASNINWQTKRNFHRFREQPAEYHNSLAYYRMGMIGTILVQDMGIQYNPQFEEQQHNESIPGRSIQQWNAFFSDSRDVFLCGLLTGKHYGTCTSMPFLYVAIGRRLGYPVYVAARKYHLYARYEEENGKHLNVEATENQGFSTPTDTEYHDMGYLMSDEEIRDCGWLRPLSNKEVLGICLQIRSSCLRSMKRYDDEIATLTQAARYVPDNALMRRGIEKNKLLSKNLEAEDRCNDLWNKIRNSQFPTGGPKCDCFRHRKEQIVFIAGQSTDATEVEQAMSDLIRELKDYRAKISDSPEKMMEAFNPPKPPVNQKTFPTAFQNVTKDALAREVIGTKVLVAIANEPDLKSHFLKVQDYTRNGERYIPFFSSGEAFQESTHHAGLGKTIWTIDRRLFLSLIQSNQVIILDLGLPTEMRFTGAELNRIFGNVGQ